MQLGLPIKKYCFVVIGCAIFCPSSSSASPDFSPQFRWNQEGITVADNHEQTNTQNNQAVEQSSPQENKNAGADKSASTDKDASSDKTIEILESSIQIDDIIEPSASYRYSSFNKRDPFAYPDREEIFDDEFAISKLQHHDVSSLKLVGVWRLSTGISKALILTPAGEGVVAVIGDPIGQNNGEVMEIGRNKIIIREFLMTTDGTRQFNDMDMFLEDYFEPSSVGGLEVISGSDSDTPLEEELNRLLREEAPSAAQPAQAPVSVSDAPATTLNTPAPAATEVPASTDAPVSPDAPSQSQGAP